MEGDQCPLEMEMIKRNPFNSNLGFLSDEKSFMFFYFFASSVSLLFASF